MNFRNGFTTVTIINSSQFNSFNSDNTVHTKRAKERITDKQTEVHNNIIVFISFTE